MRNSIKMSRRAVLSLGLAFTMGACASAPTQEPGAALVSRGYSVSSVDLAMAENAYAKSGAYKQNEALVNQLRQSVDKKLKQKSAGLKGGKKGARVNVVLTNVRVANDTSRALLGADTHLVGNVVVTDEAGNTLAQKAGVKFVDAGTKNSSTVNGIPVGFLISTAVNSSGASDEQRIDRLSTGFSNEVVTWLSK